MSQQTRRMSASCPIVLGASEDRSAVAQTPVGQTPVKDGKRVSKPGHPTIRNQASVRSKTVSLKLPWMPDTSADVGAEAETEPPRSRTVAGCV
eukprot:527504-Prorocentrum_minimum.AAC.2